jgi:hypothetical protein
MIGERAADLIKAAHADRGAVSAAQDPAEIMAHKS